MAASVSAAFRYDTTMPWMLSSVLLTPRTLGICGRRPHRACQHATTLGFKSLAKPYPSTPAMAAGVADQVWTIEEIAALLD
jgi:hypothetical protein